MKVNDVADSKQAMLMVLVKQNLGIYFFVLILINFPSLSMCLKGSMLIVGSRPQMLAQTEAYVRLIDKYMVCYFIKFGVIS